jgi:hypothetical protein
MEALYTIADRDAERMGFGEFLTPPQPYCLPP